DTYVELGVTGPRGMEVARYNWFQAVQYCQQLDYQGKQDWRLPTLNELIAVYNTAQGAANGMWDRNDWATKRPFWVTRKNSPTRHTHFYLNKGYSSNTEDTDGNYVSCITEQADPVPVGNLIFSPALNVTVV
ncbi:DUF1566 domain-containing protein, partial [Vibrio sp. SBT000027]|uniref:Lcl domain-containing protein n=1 Tax=Vibrio sp. SBT000027 TaxID=1803384 RepID=UPI000F1D37CC